MSKFSVDLTGVGEEWPVVPEGTYNAKVVEMKQYTKADTGNTVWMVDLIIIQKGEWQDEKMRYFHTYVNSKPALAKRSLVRLLRGLGVIDDAQASGDPKTALTVAFSYGKKDEDDRTEVKAITINGKDIPVAGLRCNLVSKPRVATTGDNAGRTYSGVDSLEPFAPAKGSSAVANPVANDLWSSFPK